jgi:small conductance mechanosensitive channel
MIGAEQDPRWVRRLDELHLLTPLRVALIIAVALIVTVVLQRLVSRAVLRLMGLGLSSPRAEARRRALASALRGALVGVIWAIAVITVVGEVGINIGAFVATATVIGGAVAFGAQTMVRDVIAGFFVLAEDQYGVGDDVDLGLASGSVEKITLRSVRLRDGEGKVWFVPHGNVQRVANSSKASAAWLDLHIDRGSEVAAALEVAARLGDALRQDPIVGHSLDGEPIVIGVTDVRDDRFVVRVKAPTQPNQGDAVRRAWRVLALEAFARGDLVPPNAPTTVVQQAGAPDESTQ